jgi:hypothetical protein
VTTYDGPDMQPTQVGPQQMYGPRGGYMPYGYNMPRQQWRGMIETKPFFLTSEFFGSLLAIIAMAVAVATAGNFDAPRFWTLVTVIVAAYVISRGIAKSGTKSRAADPREDMDLFNRSAEHQHHSH